MYVLKDLSKYIHPHYNEAEMICSIIAKVEMVNFPKQMTITFFILANGYFLLQ